MSIDQSNWQSVIAPNDPHSIYRPGKESRPKECEIEINGNSEPSWPTWSWYRKKELSEFPGATGRIGQKEQESELNEIE